MPHGVTLTKEPPPQALWREFPTDDSTSDLGTGADALPPAAPAIAHANDGMEVVDFEDNEYSEKTSSAVPCKLPLCRLPQVTQVT